ncbi:MAG: single-stranded-DNA-specific exonuclease RecJ [Caldilineaceae bacterium]|nr:single-stranded-DNA-specific exonuclease RecJ [Caldilineaceae bacterium]
MQSKRWQHHPIAPKEFIEGCAEHPVLLQIVYNRGVWDAAAVAGFLNGEDALLENPYRLKDMDAAVARIMRAIEKKEVICVYGDFDADGVTATTLLVEALQAAGGRVGAYIPDRVDEGYGLNISSIEERIAGKAKLLITVDCGIRSLAEIAAAVKMGIDVIITDHHSVGPDLPPALAVINPQRADCGSSFKRLAGVGVAFRLAQAVLRAVAEAPWSKQSPDEAAETERSLLDLVAVGTIADMLPLIGENRSLVRRGLEEMRRGQRVGLFALLESASTSPKSVDSTIISFRIAPRINAAGRLQHARLAYELLRCQAYEAAYDQAMQLELLNRKRQDLTHAAQKLAESQLIFDREAYPPLIFAASDQFQYGIVGLVAGRLVDRFYRPSIVVMQGEEESRGSARSIDEFNITAALDQVSHLLVRHGGHSRAAGFTVKNEHLPELIEELTQRAASELNQHPELRPTLWIDHELKLTDIDWALHAQLARLEPVGQENQSPLFLTRHCYVRDVRAVGREGQHLKLTFNPPGEKVYDAIGFGLGSLAAQLDAGAILDVVYHLERNEWQGRPSLQWNVQDLRAAE